MNGTRCARRMVAVVVFLFALAGPAQADPPTVLYRLSGSSGFLSGCIVGPCMCPVSMSPLGGTFGLTLDPAQGLETYELSGIDWFTHWNGEIQDVITGFGSYVIDGESHRVALELQVNGGTPISIDSGFVTRGSEFPAIDITGLTDGLCYQDGVSLNAAPSAYSLDVAMSSATELTWNVVPDAAGYDVVQGDLNMLRATSGAYDQADVSCLAGGVWSTSALHLASPLPGEVTWFLVRGLPGPGYDSGGPAQHAPRDGAIDQSANGCP